MDFKKANTKLSNLVWIHRALILVAILGVFIYLTYKETQPSLTYSFYPSNNPNSLLVKRYNNPNDSPIVKWNNSSMWIANQSETHFAFKLNDIFESIKTQIYYQSPNPEQLTIRSNHQRTPLLLNPDSISIYERLTSQKWSEQDTPFENLKLYTNPAKPDFFPSFESLTTDLTKEEVMRRSMNDYRVYVIKADQNEQWQSIADFHDLGFIQYIMLAPIENYEFAQTQEISPGIYYLELEEQLHEEDRIVGEDYDFRVALEGFSPGDWAGIEQIDITVTRKPVTVDSIKQFIQNKF